MKSPSYRFKEKHKFDDLLSSDEKRKSFIKITCPLCNKEVAASDLDLSSKLAKCTSCNAVFSVGEDLSKLIHGSKSRPQVSKPANVEVFEFKDEMEISIPQPFQLLDILMFSLVTVVLFISAIYLKGEIATSVLIGAWLINLYPVYYFFNRSRAKLNIRIDQNNLTKENRPKNGVGDKSWPIEQIEQIYIALTDSGRSVMMIVNSPDGEQHVKLVSNVGSLSKAHYLEQKIENYLNIENRHVIEENEIVNDAQSK